MHKQRVPGAVLLGSDFKALGVARSLGEKGIPSIVVDNKPRSAWFSRYVVKRFQWHSQMDDPEFVSFLLHMGKQHHLEQWVLFPMQDEAVQLVAYNTQLLAQIYTLVTQEWDIVQWANDKRRTYQMAQEIGVPFPITCYPAHEDDLMNLNIPFPTIIKPAISTRLQYSIHLKALPVQSREELLLQYRRAIEVIHPHEVMVQEIIPGGGGSQYSFAAFCKEGRILSSMTARRTRQYPIDYGLGSSFVEALPVPALQEFSEKLLEYMHVTGMVEVEFKFDERDQHYKLLDINLRPWGWHTLCIACGLDFPYIQYCDALGIDHNSTATPSRYDYHWIRFLTDIPAGVQEIRAGITTPGRYVLSLLGKTEFSVLDWRDPLPALGDFMVALSRVLKKPPKKGTQLNMKEVLRK
ncbi:MAG: carboxylate--amine ligase [Ktedonobacteraceae bacterium]